MKILHGIFVMSVLYLSTPLFGQDVGDVTQGTLKIISEEEENIVCPLKHTSVKTDISGYIARVSVKQRFTNPFVEPIEAVYIFPLPQNSAVDDMIMKIGDRVIRGEIKKHQEARELYEQARRQGKTTSLLEQERPNIFTQSIANIMPGDSIEISIQYVQTLKYDFGERKYRA